MRKNINIIFVSLKSAFLKWEACRNEAIKCKINAKPVKN